MTPALVKFVLTTDLVLFGAALLAAIAGAGRARTVSALVLCVGMLIGAVEGVPKTVAALKALS